MNGHFYDNRLAGTYVRTATLFEPAGPRIVGKLEEKVTELAEWSCCKVRETIKQRGDDWVGSYDSYLTRGQFQSMQ